MGCGIYVAFASMTLLAEASAVTAHAISMRPAGFGWHTAMRPLDPEQARTHILPRLWMHTSAHPGGSSAALGTEFAAHLLCTYQRLLLEQLRLATPGYTTGGWMRAQTTPWGLHSSEPSELVSNSTMMRMSQNERASRRRRSPKRTSLAGEAGCACRVSQACCFRRELQLSTDAENASLQMASWHLAGVCAPVFVSVLQMPDAAWSIRLWSACCISDS